MSKFNGRKVTSVRMHAGIHVTGAGNLDSPINATKTVALRTGLIELSYEDGTVIITNTKTKDVAVIPSGNIQSIELAPEKNSKQ